MKRGAVVGIVVGAVAVVAVVVGAAVWWSSAQPQTVDAAAREYLRALEEGDAAAIESLRDAPLDDVTRSAFASADAYIVDPRIARVDEDAARAAVTADAEIAGERRKISFALEEAEGEWRLTDDIPVVRIETAFGGSPGGGDSVWIGDALVGTADDVGLLPAVYTVRAAPRGILAGEVRAIVAETGATVELDTSLAADAASLAQEQLDAYLDGCTAPAAAVPGNCGIRVPWAADLASLERIAFRVEQYPALRLADDGASFEATGGILVATATGQTRGGELASFTYRAEDWAVRGAVRFTGDEMVLSVD